MLVLYDTLTRGKREFTPIEAGRARMYVCGMTVYDYCHLGHARVMVVFDMVQRWLRVSDFELTYVRNITDIDDKIIARAAQNGEPIDVLTARFITAMDEDASALGVEKPDYEPRATQHVEGMIAMIARLIDKNLAYRAENGDVYYSVHAFPHYGKLSGKSLDDLRAGERVEVDTHKRDPLDFVLWKSAKPGEPSWDAPWGSGRPGWHIECSVMSEAHLGAHFDIHGGGQDLQFPHHENEIAQSEGAHGAIYVNYWLHNGFVRVDDEKMSKSLGNFFTIREVLKSYDAEVIRYFILAVHYRSPLSYSEQQLDSAKQALTRLYTALKDCSDEAGEIDWSAEHAARFKAAMDDDFNTSQALAVLFDLAHTIQRAPTGELKKLLRALGGILGLLQRSAEEFLQSAVGDSTLTAEMIDQRIEARRLARAGRDFAAADRIRDELAAAGIVLEDSSERTLWRRG